MENSKAWPEVLVVPESVTVQELGAFFDHGELPPGSEPVTFAEFTARGRLPDCECGLITCVCAEARQHRKGCQYRLALTCAVPITCEPHGRDVCPECDVCNCA